MKIPKARKLSSGTWFIQLRLGGVSVPVTGATERECNRAAALIKAEHGAGKLEKKRDFPKLSDAIDSFVSTRRNSLSPSSIRTYMGIKKNRLKDVMEKPLNEIKDWQAVMNAEAAKYSAKTVKTTWGFVSTILRENGIQPPKVKLPQVVKHLRPYLEPAQVLVFVDAVKGHLCEKVALLALHSLRESEIYAIDASKINLKKKEITVSGAVVPDENHKYVRKETNKTAGSQRTVPIMIPRLLEIAGDDTPLPSVSAAYKGINRVCKAAGLPEVGVHGLRYSFASLAYHLGWNERQIMEAGGWSDYQTMHRIYIRISENDRRDAAKKMQNFYKNAN